jgi:hypothetical protein
MSNSKKNNSFLSWFKSNDEFGVPIGLNYRGAGQNKTYLGAFVTLLFNIFMIYAATMRLSTWWMRKSPKFTPYHVNTDLHDEGRLNIAENNWNYAVGLYSIPDMKYYPVDPRLGKLISGMM